MAVLESLGIQTPVVQAGILFTVITYITANLLVDLLNAVLDPRIARSLKQAA